MRQGEPTDIPELPKPWGPKESPEVPAKPGDRPAKGPPGCNRFAVLGCGCVGFGIALLLILGVAMSGRIVNWFLDTSREAIFEALPDEITEDERHQLGQAFRNFSAAIKEGSIDTQGVTQLQLELTNAYTRAKNGALEAVDVRRLLGAFGHVLGEEEQLPGGSPAQAPGGDGPGNEDAGEADDRLEVGSRILPVASLSLRRPEPAGPQP